MLSPERSSPPSVPVWTEHLVLSRICLDNTVPYGPGLVVPSKVMLRMLARISHHLSFKFSKKAKYLNISIIVALELYFHIPSHPINKHCASLPKTTRVISASVVTPLSANLSIFLPLLSFQTS